MKTTVPLFLLLSSLVAFPSTGLAQGGVPDLRQASIEDLMSIEITSASRKEQRAWDVAAAVYCKRIRSDDNYWEQVESYITEHTDAMFSHGICPSCLVKAMEEVDSAAVLSPAGRE